MPKKIFKVIFIIIFIASLAINCYFIYQNNKVTKAYKISPSISQAFIFEKPDEKSSTIGIINEKSLIMGKDFNLDWIQVKDENNTSLYIKKCCLTATDIQGIY